MSKVFDMKDREYDISRLRGKHIAIFFGCDVPPNFIHLYAANMFNMIRPSEVSVLLLTHNMENNYFNHYHSLFTKLIETNTNIIHGDDIVFNIELRDLPDALWELELSRIKTGNLPFRNLSLYDIISTIIEPIHLFKNFSVDYLVINPFLKELYNLQRPGLQKRFIYFEIMKLKRIPKLNITENLRKIDMEFLKRSLVPFTSQKNKKKPDISILKDELRQLIRKIYQNKDAALRLKMSDPDKVIDVAKSFSTTSKIRIIQMLKKPANLSEISKRLKISVSTVKKHLDEMESAGIIFRSINKKYYLKTKDISIKIEVD